MLKEQVLSLVQYVTSSDTEFYQFLISFLKAYLAFIMPAPILLSSGLADREWILLSIPVYSSWTYNEYTESMEPGRPLMSYLSPSEASNKRGVFNYIIFRLLA